MQLGKLSSALTQKSIQAQLLPKNATAYFGRALFMMFLEKDEEEKTLNGMYNIPSILNTLL